MQVTHHLFPYISHVHYHHIQPIIKSFCLENNLPYHEYSTMAQAICAHFKHLQNLSCQPSCARL